MTDSLLAEELEAQKKELEKILQPLMQKMYAANAQAGQQQGMPQTGMPQTGMPQTAPNADSSPIIEEDDVDIADVD